MTGSGFVRSLVDAVSDGVIVYDHHGCVFLMNPEAEALTGYTSEEAAGLPISEICVLVDQPTRTRLVDLPGRVEGAGGRVELTGVTVIESRQGEEKLVKGAVFSVPGTGEDREMAGCLILTDVTSKWMMDASSLRSGQMEYVRTLIRGMVYNQEDLLTALLSNLASMERTIDNPGGLRRLIADAERLIDRISSGSSGMLASSRSGETNTEVAQAAGVLRRCLRGISSAFPEVQVEVCFPDRIGFAAIPPNLFEQILNGYLVNAVESQEFRGSVMLSGCRVDLAEEMKPLPPGSYVFASVRDQGPGIPDDEITRVFEPFYTTKGGDRGLGLAACWSISHRYGGYITLLSRIGKGSGFGVYIPMAEGMDIESMGDRMPFIRLQGFTDGSEASDLLLKLESIGCTALSEETEEPAGPELVVIRMSGSDVDRWSELSSPAETVLYALDEDAEPPAGMADSIYYINSPFHMLSVIEAVASIYWKRGTEDFLKADDRTAGTGAVE